MLVARSQVRANSSKDGGGANSPLGNVEAPLYPPSHIGHGYLLVLAWGMGHEA